MVWFGQLLDPLKKNFFKNSQKFAIREIRKIPYETQLFPKHALPIFLALHSHYTGDTPYRVWFDLGNSLTRWKRIIFKILKNSPFAKIAKFRMKTQLFPRHALPNSFLLYTPITLVILHTEFGLMWTTPWPDEKQLFLNFSKFRNSRNSQNSVWKTIFLLGELYQQLFCFTLSLHWWYSIPSLVWFGQLLNPMKKQLFLELSKIRNSRNSQNSVWKLIFFLGKLKKILFALHYHYTGDTQCRIWFDLGNSLTRWKTIIFKILKNSQFAKFAKFPMKTHFFPRQAIRTTLTLHCHYNGDTQHRGWFDLDNSLTRWKRIFFKLSKIRNSRNSQNSVWITIFS